MTMVILIKIDLNKSTNSDNNANRINKNIISIYNITNNNIVKTTITITIIFI